MTFLCGVINKSVEENSEQRGINWRNVRTFLQTVEKEQAY